MQKKGFTLIELMIVIAIIGILAAVAIPKFADMVAKSKEGATKASLGAIRGALTVYYGENEGKYPVVNGQTDTPTATTVLDSALVPKYIAKIDEAKLPKSGCTDNRSTVYAVNYPTANVNANGGWAYDGNENNQSWGNFMVNCSSADLKGNPWTSY